MEAKISGISNVLSKEDLDADSLLELINATLKKSKITIDENNSVNVGIFAGTTFSNLNLRVDNFKKYLKDGIRAASPAIFPLTLISYLAGYFSIKLKIKGIHNTFSSGYSSGFDALKEGLFFLKRDRRNKSLVVELGEKIINKRCALKSGVCLALENPTPLKDSCYGYILAIESFFEKKGDNSGLINAISRALSKCSLGVSDIDFIFSSASSSGRRFILEKAALKNSNKAPRTEPALSLSPKISYPGLISVSHMLEKRAFKFKNKKSIFVMFLNLGQNTNSSCLVIKVPN
jgi:hypothetical protein